MRKPIVGSLVAALGLVASMTFAGKLDKVAELVAECRAGRDRSCQSLAEVAKHDKDEAVRKAAIEAIPEQAVLAEIAKNDRSYGNFTAAIGRLTDQSLLAEIARTGNEYVRKQAVEKLTDQAVLAEIAKKDGGELVRLSAVFRLTDPALLAGIARTDPSPHVRGAAVRNPGLTDQQVLSEIAKSDSDQSVRGATALRLFPCRAARVELSHMLTLGAVVEGPGGPRRHGYDTAFGVLPGAQAIEVSYHSVHEGRSARTTSFSGKPVSVTIDAVAGDTYRIMAHIEGETFSASAMRVSHSECSP